MNEILSSSRPWLQLMISFNSFTESTSETVMTKMALDQCGQIKDLDKYCSGEQILNMKSISRFGVLHSEKR